MRVPDLKCTISSSDTCDARRAALPGCDGVDVTVGVMLTVRMVVAGGMDVDADAEAGRMAVVVREMTVIAASSVTRCSGVDADVTGELCPVSVLLSVASADTSVVGCVATVLSVGSVGFGMLMLGAVAVLDDVVRCTCIRIVRVDGEPVIGGIDGGRGFMAVEGVDVLVVVGATAVVFVAGLDGMTVVAVMGAAACFAMLRNAAVFGDVPDMMLLCMAAMSDASNTIVEVRCATVWGRMAGLGCATDAARASVLATGWGCENAKPPGEKNAAYEMARFCDDVSACANMFSSCLVSSAASSLESSSPSASASSPLSSS